jgi:DNA-3-methyladenine glycosylase
MAKRRGQQVKVANLTNGPSKLCMAMGISRAQNKTNLTAPPFYVDDAALISQDNILETTRVGVDYSGDWKNKLWRFYIRENSFVSVK